MAGVGPFALYPGKHRGGHSHDPLVPSFEGEFQGLHNYQHVFGPHTGGGKPDFSSPADERDAETATASPRYERRVLVSVQNHRERRRTVPGEVVLAGVKGP